MTSLLVKKESGELLFDTSLICYGLVKSAYLLAGETWQRKTIRSVTNDPDQGSSYNESLRTGDQMFTISVPNARSPVVFLVGKGALQGTSLNGTTLTFHFSGASGATKAYVYDLMADNMPGSPYLKTRNINGEITFNSLQPPMNVAAAVQAPQPGAQDQWGRRPQPYAGGAWQRIRPQTAAVDFQADFTLNVPLDAGQEYAAFLPWARGANGILAPDLTGVNVKVAGFSEGCFGYTGGITFIFTIAGATAMQDPSTNQLTIPGSLIALPVDRFPIALCIKTAGLPFPYN